MSSSPIDPQLNQLRLRETTTTEEKFADLDGHHRVDMRLKEILQTKRREFDRYLEQGKDVAKQVVELLKTRLSVDRHFVVTRFGQRVAARTTMPINLYIVFKALDTSAEWRSCASKILNSVYFVLSLHSSYKLAEKHSSIQLTDVKTGIMLCLFVIPNNQQEAVWEKVQSVLTSWPVSSLALKTLIDPDHVPKIAEFLNNVVDQFTQDVVTLAKIWNSNCQNSERIQGNSMIVELVAIKAVQEELEKRKDYKTLASALERFFVYMNRNLASINIDLTNKTIKVSEPEKVIHGEYDFLAGLEGCEVNLIDPDPTTEIHYPSWSWVNAKEWKHIKLEAQRSLGLLADVERGKKPADCLIGM